MITSNTKAIQVFKLSEKKQDVISPPKQVFVNTKFQFLLTIGHYLADNETEYQKLINLLKELNEKEFYLLENLGATVTDRSVPHEKIISVKDDFESFDRIVKSIEPPFGFAINSFYVFGQNTNWGIYICENPTINIIGCTPDLALKFSEVFNVVGNGFLEQVDFIAREYQYKEDLLDKLVENYKLRK